jgi:4-hydroxythreonine-4-phosphate dehydrogenase
MKDIRPVISITMGDPVGIGPEIILFALQNSSLYKECRPLVIGDLGIMESAMKCTNSDLDFNLVDDPGKGIYKCGQVDLLRCSDLNPDDVSWGLPTTQTGMAMVSFIETATEMAILGQVDAVVTCPINKEGLKMAGSKFPGHTELIANRTNTKEFAMMLSGTILKVVLVTIHMPLKKVHDSISTEKIFSTIKITSQALTQRFGIERPCIGVAALNPHAGEKGMFGDEEEELIIPAVKRAKEDGINVKGPFPPDTVFYNAKKGAFDAVVCMYHDQGLIPFKLMHFSDGVNTTLGLPIIRTSVDHGTAYDIAGTGKADHQSLMAAIEMATKQALSRRANDYGIR